MATDKMVKFPQTAEKLDIVSNSQSLQTNIFKWECDNIKQVLNQQAITTKYEVSLVIMW